MVGGGGRILHMQETQLMKNQLCVMNFKLFLALFNSCISWTEMFTTDLVSLKDGVLGYYVSGNVEK